MLTTVMIGTIVIPLMFIGVAVKDRGAVLCDSREGCIGVDTSCLMGIFASFYATAWIPSLFTLVVVTIWSCALFKKDYAGSDARLNRRIIVMPLIMPVITATLTSIATLLRIALWMLFSFQPCCPIPLTATG